MQHRILGRTGLSVSEVGFGGGPAGIAGYLGRYDPNDQGDRRAMLDALDYALDIGLNFLDTAPAYGDGIGESLYGEVIGRRRDECVVSTKFAARDAEGIRRSCEESLTRLRTDHVDILQFHGAVYTEEEVDGILERGGLEALEALRDEGKVRFIGFTGEAANSAMRRLVDSGRFDVMQVRYNLMYQEAYDLVAGRGIMAQAEKLDMGMTLMRPLTSGLFGRWLEAVAPEVATQLDLPALLLNWVLSNPLMDVAIVGMRSVDEVRRNSEISDDVASRLDLKELHRRVYER